MIAMKNKRAGFTLMELMIVIVLIGILLAIAAISHSNFTRKANDSVCMSNLRTIKHIRMYNYINNGSFGDDINDLAGIISEIGFLGDNKMSDLECPAGGIYSFNVDSPEVTCSIARHNQ